MSRWQYAISQLHQTLGKNSPKDVIINQIERVFPNHLTRKKITEKGISLNNLNKMIV